MAWELYQRSIEWEEMPRVPLNGSAVEKKQAQHIHFSEVVEQDEAVEDIAIHISKSSNLEQGQVNNLEQGQRVSRNRRSTTQTCTNMSHMLTLRSQGTKRGCSTICGGCGQEISWD